MNFFESHFWYSKSQRNGILLLVFLIIALQIVLLGLDSLSDGQTDYSDSFQILENRLDSLKKVELADSKFTTYPFNPNYLTDFKGYQIGMTCKEIDRLFAFRKTNQFIESAQEFQQVTLVSDSLLAEISPLFKFPSWLANKSTKQTKVRQKLPNNMMKSGRTDLNQVTAGDLMTVSGVSHKMANRIIAYRKKLKGFSLPGQLFEVYYLKEQTAKTILSQFKIETAPNIKKLNLNAALFKELLALPYLDYELTKKIWHYKKEVLMVSDLNELKKIDSFPLEKFERIALYLTAQ